MMLSPTGEGAVREAAHGAHTRRITVTNTDILRSGFSGRKWTLFAITANDEQGNPIAEPMRSFQRLTGTITCLFEPYDKEPGVWTLKEVGADADVVRARRSAAREQLVGKANTPAALPVTPSCNCAAEIDKLGSRLTNLESRFTLLTELLED